MRAREHRLSPQDRAPPLILRRAVCPGTARVRGALDCKHAGVFQARPVRCRKEHRGGCSTLLEHMAASHRAHRGCFPGAAACLNASVGARTRELVRVTCSNPSRTPNSATAPASDAAGEPEQPRVAGGACARHGDRLPKILLGGLDSEDRARLTIAPRRRDRD